MKAVCYNLIKIVAPIVLVVLSFVCLLSMNANNQNLDFLAENVSQTETSTTDSSISQNETDETQYTFDENGMLNLERWEDYASNDQSTGATQMSLTLSTDDYYMWGKNIGKVYIIKTAEQLAELAKRVNTDTYGSIFCGKDSSGGNKKKNYTIVLEADIDLTGKIWTPIGYDSSHPFNGVFYGNGHVISGIMMDNSITGGKALFGYSSTATIADLIVKSKIGCEYDIIAGGYVDLYGCYGTYKVKGGNQSNCWQPKSSGKKPKGVDNYYCLIEGVDVSPSSDNPSELSVGKINTLSFSLGTNKTVTGIKIYEFDFEVNSFGKNYVSYHIPPVWDQKDQITKICLTLNDGQDKRNYKNFSSTSTSISFTANCARQTYIKIVLEIGNKTVKPIINYHVLDTSSIERFNTNLYRMANLKTIYGSTSKGDISWKNDNNAGNGIVVGGKITQNDIETEYARVGENLTFSIDKEEKANITRLIGNNGKDDSCSNDKKELEVTVPADGTINIYILNLVQVTVNGAVDWNSQNERFSVANTIISAYRITDVGGYKSGYNDKLVFDEGDLLSGDTNKDTHIKMLDVDFASSKVGGVNQINTSDLSNNEATISNLVDNSTVYAWWKVLPVNYEFKFINNSNKVLSFYALDPNGSKSSKDLSTETVEGKTVFILYYTEKLFIVDKNSTSTQPYYLTLTGENDRLNSIIYTRDFGYSGESQNNKKNENGVINGGIIGITGGADYYCAIMVSVLAGEETSDNQVSYKVTSAEKTIDTVNIKFKNGDTDVTDKETLEKVFSTLKFGELDLFNYFVTGSNCFTLNLTEENRLTVDSIGTISWTKKNNAPLKIEFDSLKQEDTNTLLSNNNVTSYLDNNLQFKVDQIGTTDGAITITINYQEEKNKFQIKATDENNAKNLFKNSEISYSYKLNDAEHNDVDYSGAITTLQEYDSDPLKIKYNTKYFDLSKIVITGNYSVVDGGSTKKGCDTLFDSSKNDNKIEVNIKNDTITIPAIEAYYADGIIIEISFTEKVYKFTVEVTNGTIDGEVISSKEYSFSYLDTISIAKDVSNDQNVIVSVTTNNSNLSNVSHTIAPKSSHYTLKTENLSLFEENGIDFLKDENFSYNITYTPKTYTVELVDVAECCIKNADGTYTLTFAEISNVSTGYTSDGKYVTPTTPKNYFKFDRFEIQKKDRTWVVLENNKNYLINDFKFYQNDSWVEITLDSGYLNGDVIKIRKVYTPCVYTFEFKGVQGNETKEATISLTFLNNVGNNQLYVCVDGEYIAGGLSANSTLDTIIENNKIETTSGDFITIKEYLSIEGYDISSFAVKIGETNIEGTSLSDILASVVNTDAILDVDVIYTGKTVTFHFKGEDNYYYGTLNGVYGTAIDFKNNFTAISKTGYILKQVSFEKDSNGENIWKDYDKDTSYIFNSYESGKISYDVYVRFESITKKVTFDGTYLPNKTNVVKDIEYNAESFTDTPVPTRAGFTFKYWATSEMNGGEPLYKIENGNITRKADKDKKYLDNPYLYAYWAIDESTFANVNESTTLTYTGSEQSVSLITFASFAGLSVKDYNIEYSNSSLTLKPTLNGSTLTVSGFKYVSDSGTISFYYSYKFDENTGAGSINFVVGDSYSKIRLDKDNNLVYVYAKIDSNGSESLFEHTITINKAQLSFGGNITKVFDGTNVVLQTLTGIQGDDSIVATYEDVNVGTNKTIKYAVSNAGVEKDTNLNDEQKSAIYEKIKGSYSFPIGSGEIKQLEIVVMLNGSISIVVDPNAEDVTIANLTVSGADSFTDSINKNYVSGIKFEGENSNAWEKLKDLINFTLKIKTSEVSEGTYSFNDQTLKLLVCDFEVSKKQGQNVNGTILNASNYICKVEGSVELKTLAENEKGFIFTAQTVEDDQVALNYVATENDNVEEEKVKKENNELTLYAQKDNWVSNPKNSFGINFEGFTGYWISSIEIFDENGTSLQNAVEFVYDSNSSCYKITITTDDTHKWYKVNIVLTNKSKVILKYALAENENIDGLTEDELEISINENFQLPTLSRADFKFDGWTQILNDQTTKITSDTWNISQTTVTLYALWEYVGNPNLNVFNISKTYDGENSTPSWTLSSNNNSFLTYEILWKKSDSDYWFDKLELKNVNASGDYVAKLTVKAIVENAEQTFFETETTFNVTISKKEVTFANGVNKVFDGYNYLIYAFQAGDFGENNEVGINNELVGKQIKIIFADTIAGSKASGLTVLEKTDYSEEDFNIVNNYDFKLDTNNLGQIEKRKIEITLGEENSFEYTGGYFSTKAKTLTDNKGLSNEKQYNISYAEGFKVSTNFKLDSANFAFDEIYVTTKGKDYGTYSYGNGGLTLTVTFKNGVSENNFEFTLSGSITITKTILKETEVTIKTEYVYNGETQTIKTNDITFTPTIDATGKKVEIKNSDGTSFAGLKDVGEQQVIVVIKLTNYEDYEKEVTFKVTPLYVTLQNNGEYSKTYDATINVNFDKNNITIGNYFDKNGEVLSYSGDLFKDEILSNYTFAFNDKNVGESKEITYTKDSSYKNIEIKSATLKGKIQKLDVTLQIVDTKVYDKNNEYFVNATQISLIASEKVFTDETMSGELKISKALAIGENKLFTLSLSEYSLNSLTMQDGKNINENYNVTALSGSITLNKAKITVELVKNSYVYTGIIVILEYKVTIETNGEAIVIPLNSLDENEYVEVSTDAQNASTYVATVGLNSDLANSECYSLETSTLPFEITKKQIEININESQPYDGQKFTYKLENTDAVGIISGHNIVNSLQTKFNLHGTYDVNNSILVDVLNGSTIISGDNNANKLQILDKSGSNVTSNYAITLSGTLTITLATGEAEIVEKSFTYNGSSQKFNVKVTLNKGTTNEQIQLEYKSALDNSYSTDEQIKEYLTTQPEIQGFIKLYFIDASGNKVSDTQKEMDFKYASKYQAEIYSLNFNTITTGIFEIVPKTIEKSSIQGFNKNKQYDGTTAITYTDEKNKNFTSSDICSGDERYLKISAEYSGIFGEAYINFALSKVSDDYVAEKVFNSYKLSGDIIIGTIDKRDVTFTANLQNTYYYNGEALKINVIEFGVTGGLVGESFVGTISFDGIINAGTYTFEKNNQFSPKLDSLTVSGNNSSIDRYNITFAEQITIAKAVVTILSCSDNEYVYDGLGKQVKLVATISGDKGKIKSGDEGLILSATYGNGLLEAINAGDYQISPKVNDSYANNYELQSGVTVSQKLIITKRQIVIKVDESIYVNNLATETSFTYYLKNSDVQSSTSSTYDLISGHSLSGTIETNGKNVGVYTYSNASQNNTITLGEDIKIFSGTDDVTSNYVLSYELKLTIEDTLGEGEIYIVSKGTYTYNGEDQINDIKFEVRIGKANGTYETKDTSATNIYDIEDEHATPLTEVKDAGTYYARINLDAKIYGLSADELRWVTFEIKKKEISTYTYNGESFTGNKVYDGENKLIVLSSDICPNDDVTITVKYENANKGAKITSIDLTGASRGNYIEKFINGTIQAKQVNLTLSSGKSVIYAGETTTEILASEFTCNTLLSGHTLSGSVTIKVKNVGSYNVKTNIEQNNLIVLDSSNQDVSSNYELIIDDSAFVEVTKKEITLTFNDGGYEYIASDILQNVIGDLSVSESTFDAEVKDVLKNNFLSIFTIKCDGLLSTEIKNAGKYTFEIKNASLSSNNFTFTIESSKNVINIAQKVASINFKNASISYQEYIKNNKKYFISNSQIFDVFADDLNALNISVTVTGTSIEANEKYTYGESGLEVTIPDTLSKNYTFTITGDLTIIVDMTSIRVENPTYEGKDVDLFDKIKVFDGEDELEKEKVNSSDKITFVSNTGYEIFAYIDKTNNIKAKVTVKVLAKKVTSIIFERDKEYDGTNKVFNASVDTELTSADFVSGDDVYAKATYGGVTKGIYQISFTLYGTENGNYELNVPISGGEIKAKVIEVQIPLSTEFVYSNLYEYTYAFNDSLTLANGDVIEQESKTITFKYASVGTNIDVANISTVNFVVKNNAGKFVTENYQFVCTGTITIIPRQFKVTLTNNSYLTYDTKEKPVSFKIEGIDSNNVLTEAEIEEIKKSILIQYTGTDKSTLVNGVVSEQQYNSETAPKNVGSYLATVSYNENNYKLAKTSSISFEITQFVFEINQDNAVGVFEVDESEIATKALTFGYDIQFAGEKNIHIIVTFENADANNNLGFHNIKVKYCDNGNFKITATDDALKNKLKITANENKTLEITLTNYKKGELKRYYGRNNIGVFDLSEFNFTCKVGDKTLLVEEIEYIALGGTVTFNSGDVADGYTLREDAVTSAYKNITISTTLTLSILKRTINLTLSDSNDYNKYFDGTTNFDKSFTLRAEPDANDLSDSFDTSLPTVTLLYGDYNVGIQDILISVSDLNNYTVVLADNIGAQGKILKREISVGFTKTSFTYGEIKAEEIDGTFVADLTDFINITDISSETLPNLSKYIGVKIKTTSSKVSTAKFLICGEYDVTYEALNSGNVNITGEKTEKITILQKEIALILLSNEGKEKTISKEQDGTTDVLVGDGERLSLNGVLSGDVVKITSANYTTATAGNDIKIEVVLAGADNGNYTVKASGNILPKNITIVYNYNKEKIVAGNIVAGKITDSYNYYSVANDIPTASHSENGYTFVGWSLNADDTTAIDFTKPLNEIFTTFSATVNVYAVWKINQFEVTVERYIYDYKIPGYKKDANFTTIILKNYAEQITLSDYSVDKGHYTYIGYKVNNEGSLLTLSNEIVNKNKTISLYYDLNKYTVTFESDVAFTNLSSNGFEYSNGNKSAVAKIYYGQTLQEFSSNVVELLNVAKIGYSLTGYKNGEITKTLEQLKTLTLEKDETFTAVFEANEYTLTLNAGENGSFSLTEYQQNAGWKVVDSSDNSKVQKKVAYDEILTNVPQATKTYYTLKCYALNSTEINLTNPFNFTENVELTAIYVDNTYKLRLNINENAIIFVKSYINNEYVKEIQKQTDEQGEFYSVSTSMKVDVIITANLGYSITKVGGADISQNSYTHTIDGFTSDVTLKVTISPNNNTIKLVTNNTSRGNVTKDNLSTSSSGELEFTALTGQTFTFEIVENEGYQLDKYTIVGSNNDKISVTLENGKYTVSGFVDNFEIQFEFVPKQVEISFEFENIEIKLNNILYTANFTKKVYVEEVISFEYTLDYGYKYVGATFTPNGSTNSGTISVNENIIKFENFTSNGTILVKTEKLNYNVCIKLAEFDETTNSVTFENLNASANLVLNGSKSTFDTSLEFEYKSQINITISDLTKGFKIQKWSCLEQNETLGQIISFGEDITVSVEKDITICLVLERELLSLKFESMNGGTVLDSTGNGATSFTENVYFGRDSKGATALVNNDFTKFEGWFKKLETGELAETPASKELQLKLKNVDTSATYIAKFKGEEINARIIIITNTKREELFVSNLQSLITYDGSLNATESYSNGQEITYKIQNLIVNDSLTFSINLPEWFEIKSVSSALLTGNKVLVDKLTPNTQDETGELFSCVVELKVKTYKIKINQNISEAISKINVREFNSKFLVSTSNDSFVVEYGGAVELEFKYNDGYMLKNITYSYSGNSTTNPIFVFENNIAKMENIYKDVTCNMELAISRFKVKFNFNYIGESFPDSNVYEYYVEYGSTDFKSQNGEIVTLPETIINPKSVINGPYSFRCWNNSITGIGLYDYYFDSDGKIFRLIDGEKVYGFIYDLSNTSTLGAIEVNLYGAWNYDKYKVNVEFAPDTCVYSGNIYNIFISTAGTYPVYENNECKYVLFAVDTPVYINAPEFNGFQFYGWKIKDSSDAITKGESKFTMPDHEITVVLYYSFEIKVEIEEPIKDKNRALVNEATVARAIVGELIDLKAIPGYGYEFDHWKVNGIIDTSLTQNCKTTAIGPCTYTAVFKVKNAIVELQNNEIATLRANKTTLNLGEMLIIYVDNIAQGYKIVTLTINDVGDVFTLSDDKTFYYHIITSDDVENSLLIIKPITGTKDYVFEYKTNYDDAGVITVNEVNAKDLTLTFNYNMKMSISTTENLRYILSHILINGVEIKAFEDADKLNFEIILNQNISFTLYENTNNIVQFVFEKLLWTDIVEEFIGEGTENNPYLILNERQLAYMQKVLNSGELDQYSTHLYFMLMADLNMEERFWIPIGTKQFPFNGTFILNDHTITGVTLEPDVTYEVLSWETKLYGVFGYITDEAELIFKISKLPIILIVSSCALFVIALIAVVVIIVVKKKKKIQKLSKKISIDTLTQVPEGKELNEDEIEKINIEKPSENIKPAKKRPPTKKQ